MNAGQITFAPGQGNQPTQTAGESKLKGVTGGKIVEAGGYKRNRRIMTTHKMKRGFRPIERFTV